MEGYDGKEERRGQLKMQGKMKMAGEGEGRPGAD